MARAFWLREPGVGEIRPVALPEPGPGRGRWCARCAPGSAAAPRRWCSAGGVPAEPVRRDARAVPGGRLPRPGEVRLPQRRRGRAAARRSCSAAPSSACTRTRPRTWCRPAPWSSCPTTCRRRGPCSPAPWRPRSTRCGTPRRWSATGSPSSAPAWSAAASRGCSPGSPASRSRSSTSTPTGPDVADALGVDFALPADAAGGRDLVVHTSATSAGLQRSLDLLAAGGHGHRAELVRRRRGQRCRSAARSTPRRLAIRASQVGTVAAGPARQPHHRRPAGARPRPAARSGLRRADHRRRRGSRSCPR